MEEEDLWESESFHSQVKEHYNYVVFFLQILSTLDFRGSEGLFSNGNSISPTPDTCSVWLKMILTTVFRSTVCSNFYLFIEYIMRKS